jgi:hypothetical protein
MTFQPQRLQQRPHLVIRHEDVMPTRWIVSKPSEKDLRVIADMAINL